MGASSKPSPVAQSSRSWRVWLGRALLLIGAPLLFLGAAEIGLRVIGYGYDPSFLVEDEVDPAKVHDHHQFAWRFFPKALARTPQPIRLLQKKPAGLRRIIVFGGSAAMGDPEPAFGLPRVIGRLLEARYPNETFEVINAAVTAINSHVVLSIARDCVDLDADLWIVYMGNNEVNGPFGSGSVFGSRRPSRGVIQASLAYQETRLGQWMASWLQPGDGGGVPQRWGGMEMFLEQQVPENDPDLQRVYDNFSGNLRAIQDEGRRAGVPVILSTVAVNLEDSAPFGSESVPGEDADSWTAQLGSLSDEKVVSACRKAIAEGQERSALVHFRLGKGLLALGRVEEAKAALQRACDLDTLRFRADSTINGRLRESASMKSFDTFFVDGEKRLAERDANGIPGQEYFHEHVHLNSKGNYELGLALAEKVAEVLGLEGGSSWLNEVECERQLGWTAFHHREVLQGMRQRLQQAPFTLQDGHEARDAELVEQIKSLGRSMNAQMGQRAMQDYGERIAAHPHDWVTRQQFARLLTSLNRHDEAEIQWEAVVAEVPHDLASWYHLGACRNRQQDWIAAEEALRRAVALREAHPKAWNSLGIALSRQGKLSECYSAFDKAAEVDPGYAEPLMNWGLVLLNQKDRPGAKAKFLESIAVDPGYVPAQAQLAQFYTVDEDFVLAKQVYQTIVNLLPNDPGARVNLGLAAMKLGDRELARRALQEALRLDPANRVARQGLERLGQ